MNLNLAVNSMVRNGSYSCNRSFPEVEAMDLLTSSWVSRLAYIATRLSDLQAPHQDQSCMVRQVKERRKSI